MATILLGPAEIEPVDADAGGTGMAIWIAREHAAPVFNTGAFSPRTVDGPGDRYRPCARASPARRRPRPLVGVRAMLVKSAGAIGEARSEGCGRDGSRVQEASPDPMTGIGSGVTVETKMAPPWSRREACRRHGKPLSGSWKAFLENAAAGPKMGVREEIYDKRGPGCWSYIESGFRMVTQLEK